MRSIRPFLDLVDILTHDISSVSRISSFLSRHRYQGSCTVVLKFPPFNLHLCTVQVLERRVPPILDTTATSQFPACRTGSRVVVVLFDPVRPLIRQLPLFPGSIARAFSLRASVSRTPWHSCVRLHIYPPVRITHTNNPSIRRLVTVYLLVSGATTGRASAVGQVVGGLERCVGCCLVSPLVDFLAASLTHRCRSLFVHTSSTNMVRAQPLGGIYRSRGGFGIPYHSGLLA